MSTPRSTAVADASWLVCLADVEDPRHQETRTRLETADACIVPPVAIAETMFVLTRKKAAGATRREAREAACRFVEAILATPNVRVEESMDAAAALALVRRHPKLTFEDALTAVTAQALREDLWTYDQDQRAAFESLSG